MSDAKHTPGPWSFDPQECRVYHEDHDVQPTICWVSAEAQDEQVNADLLLIAAAPDLLFALKGLLEAIGGEESTDIFCVDARAAIAKALGSDGLASDVSACERRLLNKEETNV